MMGDESEANINSEDFSFDETVLQLIDDPLKSKTNASSLRTDQNYDGFDSTMGDSWIYPTNYPVRQYQYNISHASLFKNTLVVLPTGLGKTFIASVVMYNIFRWYPRGKIIFMAPTRPLVAQQIRACYQVMGFPKDETIELTGRQSKKVRATAWHNKRVFYCTPQVVWSDMNDTEVNFPIKDVKLIVVDEAHKAKGRYAYVEVVQSIWSRNKLFRVLALSATPGRTMQDVCEVIQNLLISNIEVRRETSIDVAPYTFKKSIKTIVVPLDDRLNKIRKNLYDLVSPYVENLMQHQVIGGHVENLTKAWLLYSRNKFRESTLMNRHPEQSNILSDFSVCIGMYHAIELLERHGLRVFLNHFNDDNSDIEEKSSFLMRDLNIKQFIHEIWSNSGIHPLNDAEMTFKSNASFNLETTIDYGHPKFEILQNCLFEHFQECSDTKAIVFCEYRETVFLINHMLLKKQPLIQPKVFVGQGSSHNRTITQKEQIAIMNDFRLGKCNTLIATCVAEEGIDVGEVDFIICFDVNNKNPIRYVQRIGRTGRKRQGKVTMLVTEGKEQNILKEILATKDGINQRIGKSNEVKNILCKNSTRLVPPEFNPRCIETFIDIKNTQESAPITKANSKKSTKLKQKDVPPKTGTLKSFFKPLEIDAEMEDIFDLTSYRSDADNSLTKNLVEINENNKLYEEVTDVQKVNDDFSLEVKLRKVFNTYLDNKKSRAKWNGFGEKLSRKLSNKNTEQLPDNLVDFIDKYLKKSNEYRVFRTNFDPWQKISNETKLEFLKFMSTLTGLHNLERNTSHSSINELSNLTENEDENVAFETDVLINSQISFITQHQSKYVSQLEPHRVKSPVQQIASSTPNRTSYVKHLTTEVPIHSPIIANQFKQIWPSYQRRNEIKNEDKWYLKFLGLNTVYDLFSSEHEENARNKSDEQQKICDNLNKSICGNDNFTEENEETQYTISRILKICDDAEKAGVEKRESTKESTAFESTPKKRRLYIGSVDELFCDDDNFNDDGTDDDIFINTHAIDMSLSASDETVNYDIEDALKQKKQLQTLTNLSKNTNEAESNNSSQHFPIKSLTCVKSDELFSTYNESTSIQITPKKDNSTNLFTYHCQSPSVLIKSSSILSNRLENNQNDCQTLSQKSSMIAPKVTTQRSQQNFNKHLDNLESLDEIKENVISPFRTARQSSSRQLKYEVDSNCDTEFSGDEIFATCAPLTPPKQNRCKSLKKKRKLKKKFNFIDDEAAVSGDESSDEDMFGTQESQQIIAEECDEDDPTVDMQAKYLQSIRSPSVGRRFHIPKVVPKVTQNIFSQFVAPDQSGYEEDSFVVGSDEESTLSDGDSTDCNEITIAPSRPNKRKSDEIVQSKLKRRRRIIEMSSDSE